MDRNDIVKQITQLLDDWKLLSNKTYNDRIAIIDGLVIIAEAYRSDMAVMALEILSKMGKNH
jgi:hypothetical protein